MAIQGFADAITRDVYNAVANARTRRIPPEVLSRARTKLDWLNAAVSIEDLRSPPGNRLEALSGALAGRHSIRVNDQWRIVFRWTAAGPEQVQFVDYH